MDLRAVPLRRRQQLVSAMLGSCRDRGSLRCQDVGSWLALPSCGNSARIPCWSLGQSRSGSWGPMGAFRALTSGSACVLLCLCASATRYEWWMGCRAPRSENTPSQGRTYEVEDTSQGWNGIPRLPRPCSWSAVGGLPNFCTWRGGEVGTNGWPEWPQPASPNALS